MKRKIVFMLALALLVISFSGCGNGTGTPSILYEGQFLKVEREGKITRIYDLVGGAEYSFKTSRILKKKGEPVNKARTSTNTDTIEIKTVHGEIIVTTKTDGETLYIKN